MALWMIRAERNGIFFDDFIEKSIAGIGWGDIPDLQAIPDWDDLKEKVRTCYPDFGAHNVGRTAGMLWRIREEMEVGDSILTYDPSRRVYAVGTIIGEYFYDPNILPSTESETWPHLRSVKWGPEIERDNLSQTTRHSLGSLFTLFKLSNEAEAEFKALLDGKAPLENTDTIVDKAADEDAVVEDIEGQSLEYIKDMVAKIDPNDMEHLVAGLLRAFGYKTRVSPIGPDRGVDIIASPDALGLEDPRVIVEVKHRRGAIGAQDIRSFLGGRQNGDRGLYVSTGGFTKDARYEADRANIPLRLMASDDLVEELVAYYDALDVETRSLMPLKKIYWPVE